MQFTSHLQCFQQKHQRCSRSLKLILRLIEEGLADLTTIAIEIKQKEKPTKEKITLEDNLLAANDNMRTYYSSSLHFFNNFMVTTKLPIRKE